MNDLSTLLESIKTVIINKLEDKKSVLKKSLVTEVFNEDFLVNRGESTFCCDRIIEEMDRIDSVIEYFRNLGFTDFYNIILCYLCDGSFNKIKEVLPFLKEEDLKLLSLRVVLNGIQEVK